MDWWIDIEFGDFHLIRILQIPQLCIAANKRQAAKSTGDAADAVEAAADQIGAWGVHICHWSCIGVDQILSGFW